VISYRLQLKPNGGRLELRAKSASSRARRFFCDSGGNLPDSSVQSVDCDLSQQEIDAACAVRTSVLRRRSSKERSLIAKKFASQRIDDYLARAGGPSGGRTFNRWKTRSA
jgi:hypothetical protein